MPRFTTASAIRVDMETIKRRPGTCFNLEAVTTHYVQKGSLEPTKLSHALLGKVMAYGFGRVLKQQTILPLEATCNEMMDDAFGEEFIDDVDAIIKDIPKLRSTRDTLAMARKLIDLLINQPPSAPPTPQPAPPPEEQQQLQVCKSDQSEVCEQGSGDVPATQDVEGRQRVGGGSSSQEQDDQNAEGGAGQEQEGGDQEQEQGEDEQASGAGGNGAGSGGGKRPTPDEIAEMLKEKTGYGDLSALIQSELDDIADNTPSSIRSGIPMLPDVGRLKPQFGRLNEVEAISASSRMRAKMMGMLQSIKRKPESHGLSGRRLATGRLVRMATGDPRIFRKKIDVVEVNTAVAVLLDLSGSMSSRYAVANAAAFALHNTLFGLKGVSVCSLEFSGKNREPEVNLLVNFGKKPLSENFNHHPFDGTPTDTAIWAGRVMLLQRPEPRKIMLILTDGCPDNASETKAATQRTMRDGIEIAAIGIMDKSVRHYWDNHQIINSIQELPVAMFGVMERLLTAVRS